MTAGRSTLRRRMTFALLVSFLPMVVAITLLFSRSIRVQQRAHIQSISYTAQDISNTLDRFAEGVYSVSDAFSTDERLLEILDRSYGANPNAKKYAITYTNGALFESYSRLVKQKKIDAIYVVNRHDVLDFLDPNQTTSLLIKNFEAMGMDDPGKYGKFYFYPLTDNYLRTESYGEVRRDQVVFGSRRVYSALKSGYPYLHVFSIEEQTLYDLYQLQAKRVGAEVYILTADGGLISSTNEDAVAAGAMPETIAAALDELQETNGAVKIDGSAYDVAFAKGDSTPWTTVLLVPAESLTAATAELYVQTLSVLIVCVGIFALLIFYFYYYTTRKDNEWAKANPDEIQQCYIMTPFFTAEDGPLTIPLMKGISRELMKVNDHDDIARWWEVVDRTTGQPLDASAWHYDAASESVVVDAPAAYHEYTVSFLAYLIWDPVHMYNSVINGWTNVEHQIPFDVRQPKTHKYTMERLRRFLDTHPYVDVVRFTTFFHLFTLVFDELRREKYVDWYGYSASVCPYILEQFEKEAGYKFRPEYIIDQGYYNNQYRVPSKEFKDFQSFQCREVNRIIREMTDIVHEYGKEAMMFLGDHWIGTEPFRPEFASSGVDAIVGSVGNGSTLRLISDIEGVKYTEGRFLPYFFPDTFHEGGDPVREAKENWVTARRAILRSPIDRIGYGGYLKLACEFPEFLTYVESVCDEFRELYTNIKGTPPYCSKTVAVLNSWGKTRAWGCHMVHHALYQKQNYSYAGVIEALSGAPFDVKFISFDDIKADPHVLDGVDVLLNIGDGDTAHTGGAVWEDADISSAVRGFVWRGGGLIGVGEPGGHQYQGRYLQLASVLGVEKETGFTLNYDKYNWDEHRDHFILADYPDHTVDFGEGKKSIFALEDAEILIQKDKEVQMAVHEYGKGRGVYISGLPYSFVNNRVLHRAILWAAHDEADLHRWFSSNYNVEVHAYVKNGKYCVVNNTYEPQDTTVYTGDGSSFELHLDANEIKWYNIEA